MAQLPRNIYEQQAHNKLLTVVVLALFILFVGFLGFGFDLFLLGYGFEAEGNRGLPLPIGTIVALGIGAAAAFRSAYNGDAAVLGSATAAPILDGNPKYRQLVNVVEEMSIASGIPQPKVYLIPDPDPNAFATGRDPNHASLAVTEGLVEKLSRDELQAVVAHEMGHIRNYDIRLMTVVASLIGAVMLLTEFGTRIFQFGGGRSGRRSSRRSGGGIAFLFVFWIIALILAPVVSRCLAMAVSRQREYLADAAGAELTRNPLALASALEKIDAADDPTRSIKKGTAHLCIADPLGREANEREGFLANLLSTHPPIEKRITLLKAMAYHHE
jgi:heat shock protein HtpX